MNHKIRTCAKRRSGVSLLIAILLISIITAVAMGISNLVTQSIRNTGNINNANMAFYAAEGALEQGLLINAQKGAGYSTTASPVTLCETAGGGTCATANVIIQGVVPNAAKYLSGMFTGMYGLPTPGSGNVADNCNPLTAVVSGSFTYDFDGNGVIDGTSETITDPDDHPCNWNRLKVGETVAIPLYTTESSGTNTVTKNPADLGISTIYVRIRTACKDGAAYCSYMDRFVLDTKNGEEFFKVDEARPLNGGDTIVYWEITGSNIGGDKSYGLRANDKYNPVTGKRDITNSEIHESKINKSLTGIMAPCPGKFCVLLQTSQGFDLTNNLGLLKDFLLNTSSTIFARTGNAMINKPVLKLKVIYSLKDETEQENIPYLEYQVLMNASTSPPANVTQTITAEGLSGTFKQVLEVKQAQETGLLEYVINQ